MTSSRKNKSSERYKTSHASIKWLALVITGAVMLIFVVRAETRDIPKMWEAFLNSDIFSSAKDVMLTSIAFGSLLSLIWQTITHRREVSRLAQERDKLQNKLFEILDERRRK